MKKNGIENANQLFAELSKYIIDQHELNLIKDAYYFAEEKHKDQLRKSGEPYIIHPINVAYKLATLDASPEVIKAALLHDVIEDCDVSYTEIQNLFGKEVAFLVNGVTKISMLDIDENVDERTLQNMFKTAAEDIRVMIVKIADRIHNMETLQYMSEKTKVKKSKEVIEIYAPMAWKLGLYDWKSQLDDLAFKYLMPEEYAQIRKHVNTKKKERERHVNEQVIMLEGILEANTIDFVAVKGRAKNFYSIYKKTVKKNIRYNDVHDMYAFRIVVANVEDCYRALGLLHQQFSYLPNYFKDFISLPKENGYQSIHTTIRTNKSQLLEIQIRTEDMDHIAENGLAAHWKYKLSNYSSDLDEHAKKSKNYEWLQKIDNTDSKLSIDYIKNELLSKSVHVFTPKGEIIYLPEGSTVIDFAYQIHTELAESMIGAKVNGAIVPITYKLISDDTVEIIPGDKHTKVVNLAWYRNAKSPTAREKIRLYFRRQQKQEDIEKGLAILEYTFARENIEFKTAAKETNFHNVLKAFHAKEINEIATLIIHEEIDPIDVLNEYIKVSFKLADIDEEAIEEALNIQLNENNSRSSGVIVPGIMSSKIYLANCCMPVSGDEIKAFHVNGVGFIVHREQCNHLKEQDKSKIFACEWEPIALWDNMIYTYNAGLVIKCRDQIGLISQITSILKNHNITIQQIEGYTDESGICTLILVIKVKNLDQLELVINLVKKQNVVESVRRYYENYEEGTFLAHER